MLIKLITKSISKKSVIVVKQEHHGKFLSIVDDSCINA